MYVLYITTRTDTQSKDFTSFLNYVYTHISPSRIGNLRGYNCCMETIQLNSTNRFKAEQIERNIPAGFGLIRNDRANEPEDHSLLPASLAMSKLPYTGEGLYMATDNQLVLPNEVSFPVFARRLNQDLEAGTFGQTGIYTIDPQIQKPFLNSSSEIRRFWRETIHARGGFAAILIGIAGRRLPLMRTVTATVVQLFVQVPENGESYPEYGESVYRPEAIWDDLVPEDGFNEFPRKAFTLQSGHLIRAFEAPLRSAISDILQKIDEYRSF